MDHNVVDCTLGDHHGSRYNTRKRGAEDAFEVQSGISHHFKKLRLNHAPAIYEVPRPPATSPTVAPNTDTDGMVLDETPSKIYIHDLAAEIAEIEASEPKDFFLADVDKKVSAIPATLLQASNADPNMQLVLYKEPSSISVPEEEDAVRKAIADARRRVRERQRADREEERTGRINGERRFWPDGSPVVAEKDINGPNREHMIRGIEPNALGYEVDNDPDAMDIG